MKTLVVTLVLAVSFDAFAKRLPPAEINPIVKNGNELSFRIERKECQKGEHGCGMQVFLESKNTASKKLNWYRELYQKTFDSDLDTDVQEIYPKTLSLKNGQVLVTDEKGSKYVVNFKTGELVKPLKSVVYSSKPK